MNQTIKRREVLWINVLLCAAVLVLLFTDLYRCPVKLLTGVDCPACGMTRAFRALARFQWKEAFHAHPLFWWVGPGTVYFILRPMDHLLSRLERLYLFLTVCLLLVVWCFRVFL